MRLSAAGVPCQRRAFVRAPVNMPAVLRHGDESYEVTAIDLSEGGMRCRTREQLPIMSGTDISTELLVDGEVVPLSARIARIRQGDEGMPTDVGLSFTGMRISDADRMRRVVFEQLRQERFRDA